jgi:hypothetical protein
MKTIDVIQALNDMIFQHDVSLGIKNDFKETPN